MSATRRAYLVGVLRFLLLWYGVLIVGDSGSLLNGERLKGIHTAIKSGMLAAETILEALIAGDYSRNLLGRYETRLKEFRAGEQVARGADDR